MTMLAVLLCACTLPSTNTYWSVPRSQWTFCKQMGYRFRKKKNQWLFEWASELGRVKAVYVLSLGGKVKDPVVRRQTQCWWLKAGAQASLWLGIQLLFSFHKLISRWIWIISTLRRQNPVCGSLLYSSRPVSLLIIFHLPPHSTHFASLHFLCVCAATHKPLFLLRSAHWSCSFPLCLSNLPCIQPFWSGALIFSKPYQLIGHKTPWLFYVNHLPL